MPICSCRAWTTALRFWDLADQYGSHPHAKLALKTVKRDNVVILTKTHANTEKEMWADLDRFRQETGTDHLDIVLLHCMLNSNWPQEKAGAMHVLSEAKQKGIIRAHGVSCHDLGALKVAADSDWVDVDLARLNPAGVAMDADPATIISILRTMKQRGKGIIGMKILGAGPAARQTRRSAAVRAGAGRARLLHDWLREPERAAGSDDADSCGQHPRLERRALSDELPERRTTNGELERRVSSASSELAVVVPSSSFVVPSSSFVVPSS